MKVWNQVPLVRLLLPFLLGIICAIYFPIQVNNILLFSLCLFVIIGAIVLIPRFYISYRKSHWLGVVINLLLFTFAYQLTIFKTQKFSPNHFSNYCGGTNTVYARLADSYIEKEKSIKIVMDIVAVKKGADWVNTTGKAIIYIEKDANALHLKYGDELVMNASFKDIPDPQNPGEFNYKRFLSFHNINSQSYVKNDDWKSLGSNFGNFILKYSIGLRDKLMDVLKFNKLKDDELSVGAALLLGYTDKLDAEIISAYSSSGALHVLSVSGLHVAIVYFVFSWLLFFLDKHKHGQIFKSILLLLFLWFYAALTGLSPSVLRSATMLSFVIFAKAFNRQTNIYNTLAASVLFLLLINPYLIMDVGFQLSYLAVIGIVYIQPKIHAWFEFDNWLLNQIWTITSVSIAAQVATCPLALFYFHQFPNYFLLSNLIVIPISTVIIYIGIAVFTFAQIPVFVKYLAIVFSWLIWLLNLSVKWMESLPFSVLQGVSISVLETWLLYGVIILFLFYFSERKFRYLIYALSFFILILISQTVEQYSEFSQKKIIVYNIPKTSVFDFISSKSNILLTDSVYAQNKSGLLFHIKHNWWDLGLDNTKIISKDYSNDNFKYENNAIQFFDKKLMVLKNAIKFKNAESKQLNLDYLIVSNNTNMSLSEMDRLFHVKTIIFDSSNSEYRINKWKKECIAMNQEYFAVTETGAFEIIM